MGYAPTTGRAGSHRPPARPWSGAAATTAGVLGLGERWGGWWGRGGGGRVRVGWRQQMKYRPGFAERRPLRPLPPPRHRDAPTPRRECLRRQRLLMAAATAAAEGGRVTTCLGAAPATIAWLARLDPTLLLRLHSCLPGVKLLRGTQIDGPLLPAHSQRRPASRATPSCPAAPAGAPRSEHRGGPPPFASFSPPASSGDPAAAPPRYDSQYSTTATAAEGVTGRPAHLLVSPPWLQPSSSPC